MQNLEEIKSTIIALIKEQCEGNHIEPKQLEMINGDSVLYEIISSLDTISLVVELEKKYNIEVTDEELFVFRTIDELVKIVAERSSSDSE